MIRIFDGCSHFEHFARNWEKALKIKGTQVENKHGDPIFSLHFLNVLYGSLKKKYIYIYIWIAHSFQLP